MNVDIDALLPTVYADSNLLKQLYFNILHNAMEAMDGGGNISVRASADDDFVKISFADTGCGIPEKYRESIFQPFFRVDKSRSRVNGGVGLGLSLVWEIVALHGGEIRVEESSEKGTTIAVKLPLDTQTD